MQSIIVFLVVWGEPFSVEADKQWMAAWICDLPETRKIWLVLY